MQLTMLIPIRQTSRIILNMRNLKLKKSDSVAGDVGQSRQLTTIFESFGGIMNE